jgi:hypothetical protein
MRGVETRQRAAAAPAAVRDAWRQADPRLKLLVLLLAAAALAGLAWALPRLPQPPAYHDFADGRACLGLPNCLDTASNVFFVLAGAAGLSFLAGAAGRRGFVEAGEALPYALFFVAVVLVGIASGHYHLAPDNGRLAWDRAAIALAFMAWFAALLGERLGVRAGLRLLPLLAAAGLGSVAYWAWSETQGVGDLRPYALVQVYPLLAIPLLLRLYAPRYSGDRAILAVLGLYLLALLGDLLDRPVFALTGGLVSGHTAKHALAALAAYGVVLHLRRRRVL